MIPSVGRGRASVMPNWMKNPTSSVAAGGLQPSYQPAVQPQYAVTASPTGGWVQTQTADGKVYYSNTQTGETTFDKPEQLKSAVERQLPTSPWKEYVRDGQSYFVSSLTKQSLWEEPMELTMHRERLRSLCAGEPPTRDMNSLALYTAAQHALVELMVDVDGSLAKRRMEEEQRASTEPREDSASAKPKVQLTEISGELKRPAAVSNCGEIGASDSPQQVFSNMLAEWQVPPDATWEVAFGMGIANDSRYFVLPTLAQRKALVKERHSRVTLLPDTVAPPTQEQMLQQRWADFNLTLDQLERDGCLGPRSTFAGLAPVLELQGLDVGDDLLKQWFEQRVEFICQTKQREMLEAELAQEKLVHGAIVSQIPDAERLSRDELFDRLGPLAADLAPPEVVRKHCGTFVKRQAERRQLAVLQQEDAMRHALLQTIKHLFVTGIVSIDLRWAEFSQDEDLRTRRAPQLTEVLAPFAPGGGRQHLVERVFRQARDECSELVDVLCRKMQREMPQLASFSRRSECMSSASPQVVEELKQLELEFGRGIVDRALLDQAARYRRNRDKFFELLSRYVKEKSDGVWENIQPFIANRTAFRDMGSDQARKSAFDEFMLALEHGTAPVIAPSRRRSRSPRRAAPPPPPPPLPSSAPNTRW
ncbi:hypothetical protein BASA81_002279 [Batrachochytrium salamandrivorans]|nr:hypothetical protein BASA81_002279 [Batrachochytrium salamandrivorans]